MSASRQPCLFELALSISFSTSPALEKGAFYASLNVVGRLAKALEVEPAELLKLPPKRRGGRLSYFQYAASIFFSLILFVSIQPINSDRLL